MRSTPPLICTGDQIILTVTGQHSTVLKRFSHQNQLGWFQGRLLDVLRQRAIGGSQSRIRLRRRPCWGQPTLSISSSQHIDISKPLVFSHSSFMIIWSIQLVAGDDLVDRHGRL